MEASQPLQQENPVLSPPCVAAPKSDRGRVSTCLSFRTTGTLVNLRVLTMPCTETLVGAHLGFSAGGCWFSTHKLLLYGYPTSLAGPASIGVCSPAVESTLGGILEPFTCDLLRFGLSFSSCLVSCHSSWEF